MTIDSSFFICHQKYKNKTKYFTNQKQLDLRTIFVIIIMVKKTDYAIDVEYTLATLDYSPLMIPYMQINEKNIEEII